MGRYEGCFDWHLWARKGRGFAEHCTLCNHKDVGNSNADPDVGLNKEAFDNAYIHGAFDLEHEMCKIERFGAPNYLDIPEKELLSAKNKTLDKVITESEGRENVILAMHTVYYRSGSLFSVLDWTKLSEFKPDIFITLVDDIHAIKDRMTKKKNTGAVRLPLKDILWWREVELLVTQQIARNISGRRIPHYILARGQTPMLIYQLMFEPFKKKVYASYPVTSAKRNHELFRETSEFLRKLKKHFIVFDPMAIGEKLLQDLLLENLGTPHPEPTIVVEKMDTAKEYEVDDILPIISDINGQIVSRDQRLVMQSDIVLGYRPTLSPGVQYELSYAKNSSCVETFAVHPPNDPQSPFVYELAEVFPTVDRLLDRLQDKGYILPMREPN